MVPLISAMTSSIISKASAFCALDASRRVSDVLISANDALISVLMSAVI